MDDIKPLMTYKEIQEIGGFQFLTENGYTYYQLYHRLTNGEYEAHNLYEVYFSKPFIN